METAMEAVMNGKTSINKAAVMYNVPCTSLKDRLSGKVVHGTRPGPKRYLNELEEKVLDDHLIEAASIGYGKTRREKICFERIMYQMDGGNDLRRDSQNCHCDMVMQLHMCVWTRQLKIQLRHTTIFLKKLFKSIISLIILIKYITWMRVVFHLTHVPLILTPREGRKRYVIECLGKRSR